MTIVEKLPKYETKEQALDAVKNWYDFVNLELEPEMFEWNDRHQRELKKDMWRYHFAHKQAIDLGADVSEFPENIEQYVNDHLEKIGRRFD